MMHDILSKFMDTQLNNKFPARLGENISASIAVILTEASHLVIS
jgi:hypothetical protein